MIEAKKIESRQRERYGDFFQVWAIKTDEPKEKVLEYCFSEFCKGKLPRFAEWLREIRDGGGHEGDANYYFAGYYRLEEQPAEVGEVKKFLFTHVLPYCD